MNVFIIVLKIRYGVVACGYVIMVLELNMTSSVYGPGEETQSRAVFFYLFSFFTNVAHFFVQEPAPRIDRCKPLWKSPSRP